MARYGVAAAAAALSGGCISAGPVVPRFVVVSEQRYERCTFQVLEDTRPPAACYLFVRCGRDWSLVPRELAACVP